MAGAAPGSGCVRVGKEGSSSPSDEHEDDSIKSGSSHTLWKHRAAVRMAEKPSQKRVDVLIWATSPHLNNSVDQTRSLRTDVPDAVTLTPTVSSRAGCCQWSCRTGRSRCGCEWWWGTARWTRKRRGTAPWAATCIPTSDRWPAKPPWGLQPGGCICTGTSTVSSEHQSCILGRFYRIKPVSELVPKWDPVFLDENLRAQNSGAMKMHPDGQYGGGFWCPD